MPANKPPKRKPEASTSVEAKDFLVLGKVGRPHGLRGAFFVSGRDTPLPKAYRQVLIGSSPQTAKVATITTSTMQAQRPMLVCSLAADRTAAEALTNLWIYATKATVKANAKSDVLWSEVEGADLIDAAGLRLGKVLHVYNAGASDIVTVENDAGGKVDIPVIETYFDLDRALETAATGERRLRLLVAAETFADLWGDA